MDPDMLDSLWPPRDADVSLNSDPCPLQAPLQRPVTALVLHGSQDAHGKVSSCEYNTLSTGWSILSGKEGICRRRANVQHISPTIRHKVESVGDARPAVEPQLMRSPGQ